MGVTRVMQGKNEPIHSDENNIDGEDIDVFVSPRLFVGRTPGPKATKQRIFEEERIASHNGRSHSVGKPADHNGITLGIENVRYTVSRHQNCKYNTAFHPPYLKHCEEITTDNQ